MKPFPSPTPPPVALGRHVHLELYGCPPNLLNRPIDAERALLAAAAAMGATVIGSHFHAFSPYGVSGVVIIAESHLTVHTWPEYGYAAVDVFSCGPLDLEAGLARMRTDFAAGRCESREYARGGGVAQYSGADAGAGKGTEGLTHMPSANASD